MESLSHVSTQSHRSVSPQPTFRRTIFHLRRYRRRAGSRTSSRSRSSGRAHHQLDPAADSAYLVVDEMTGHQGSVRVDDMRHFAAYRPPWGRHHSAQSGTALDRAKARESHRTVPITGPLLEEPQSSGGVTRHRHRRIGRRARHSPGRSLRRPAPPRGFRLQHARRPRRRRHRR